MSSTIHSPSDGLFGDCMSACVASIFELPLEHVPHFTDEWQYEDFMRTLRAWLAERDLAPMFFRVPADEMERMGQDMREAGMDAFHLLSGESATGTRHSVVGQYAAVVHDPWPALADPLRGVLRPDTETGAFELCLFVYRGTGGVFLPVGPRTK